MRIVHPGLRSGTATRGLFSSFTSLLGLAQRGGRNAAPRRRICPKVSFLEGRTLLTTFTVTNTLDAGPGSLRSAITSADEFPGLSKIKFSASTFGTKQTITLNSTLPALTNPSQIKIEGPGANLLTINGNGNEVFMEKKTAQAAIIGLTITKGYTYGYGGLISNAGYLEIRDCTLTHGDADGSLGYGGAVYNTGSLALASCTLSDNSANVSGGAIYNSRNGAVGLKNCMITGNKAEADNGGGIANVGGSFSAMDSTLKSNTAYDYGGGIMNASAGGVSLYGCTIELNQAEDGAGIYNSEHSILTASVSVLQNNLATAQTNLAEGAGLATFGTATLGYCTIANNVADNSGGGIYQKNGTTSLTHCTVTDNVGTDGAGIFNKNGTINLTNATITRNRGRTHAFQTAAKGGGLWTDGGTATGVNTTITGNFCEGAPNNLYGTLKGQGNVIG